MVNLGPERTLTSGNDHHAKAKSGNFPGFNGVTGSKVMLRLLACHRFMAKSHIFDENATVTDPDHLRGLSKVSLGNMICV